MIGIILVQLYWINSSFIKNDEQFKHHTQQVLNNVAKKLDDKEVIDFYKRYFQITDSLGKAPKKEQLRKIYFYDKDKFNCLCISNVNVTEIKKRFVDDVYIGYSEGSRPFKHYFTNVEVDVNSETKISISPVAIAAFLDSRSITVPFT